MIDLEKLNKIIEQSGYKKSFLAERLGITLNTLSNKLDGKSSFKGEEFIKLTNVLNCSNQTKFNIFFGKQSE